MSDEQVRSSGEWVPITTKGTTTFRKGVRAILCGTAGTVNMTDCTGTARLNVPLQQGFNPLKPISIEAGGTASDIWVLY